jgi:glycosyltransferase involved in cell wall biosynthesis
MGGAERLLLTLFRLLPQEKIVPFLFCGQAGHLVTEARGLGIRTEIVALPKFYSTSWVWGKRKILNPLAVLWNGAGLFVAAWRLIRVLRDLQIDIIQTNMAFSHIYGGIAARILRIRCVWYFHDLVEPHRLAGSVAQIWRVLGVILPDQIICVSEAVRQSISSKSNGKVIYSCVQGIKEVENKKVFPLHKKLGLHDYSILVGTLGRIAYVKGLDILIEAASLVVSENQDVHFVIFGGALFGEENYKMKLERQVENIGLSKNWHWMGYDELAKEYLRELDFVVFPSRREAFGLTLVEAGLSGKATIATRVGGIPEIIEDGKTGILVPPEDIQQLALAILELIKKPKYAASLGQKAKDKVKKVFNEERYITEFMEFYEGLTA